MNDPAQKRMFFDRPFVNVILGFVSLYWAVDFLNGDNGSDLPEWANLAAAVIFIFASFTAFADAIAKWGGPSLLPSTWAPFQSPEVREILGHLTPGEHASLVAGASQIGKEFGMSVVALPAVAAGLFAGAWQAGFPPSILICAYIVIFCIYAVEYGYPRHRLLQKRCAKLFCQTGWAQSKGYKPETLRLRALPWSK